MLKRNSVNYSLFLPFFYIIFFLQILTTLCLEKNMIGDAGLKDLASALTTNVVCSIVFNVSNQITVLNIYRR